MKEKSVSSKWTGLPLRAYTKSICQTITKVRKMSIKGADVGAKSSKIFATRDLPVYFKSDSIYYGYVYYYLFIMDHFVK